MLAINVKLLNFSNRVISSIWLKSLFPSSIVDTMNCFHNSMSLLHQVLSEPEFNDVLVYKFKKNMSRDDFSYQFRKVIIRYKRFMYDINVMRQSSCFVIKPITVANFAALFNCTTMDWASDSKMAPN